MVRRAVISLVLLLSIVLFSPASAQSQTTNIYPGVTAYFDAIATSPTDTIINRIDLLINSVGNPEQQSQIAGIAFDYFTSSPIMGHEAVAVYIADNYFLNKKLEWSDEATYPLLYTFAEFNRASLIGKSAQDLILEDINGHNISLRMCEGEYKILYFYDDQCSTCKVESAKLAKLLQGYDGVPVTLLAVYTHDNRENWERYVKLNFSAIDNPNVTIYHLWDPLAESSYHKKFGVLSTPAMLLTDKQNIIVGRKLDCDALAQLLEIENKDIVDFRELFDNIFTELAPVDSVVVAEVAESFYKRTYQDTSLFRDSFSQLYEYLRGSRDYECKKGAIYVANNYILQLNEYWGKEYLEQIEYRTTMFSKNMLGEKAAKLVLKNKRGWSKSIFGCRKQYTVLFFHLIDCSECQKNKEIMERYAREYKKKGVRVVCIYVGSDKAKWLDYIERSEKKWVYLWDENGSANMHEKYDLLYVPKIYLLDKERKVIAKEIDATTLNELIERL